MELIELKIVIKYIQMNSGKPSKKETLGVKLFACQTSVILIWSFLFQLPNWYCVGPPVVAGRELKN